MADILYGTPLGVRENLVDMKDGSHVKCVNVISPLEKTNATITSGTSLSNAIDLKNLRLFGLDIPLGWTAANVTIQQKHTDGTYRAVKDSSGLELSFPAVAGDVIRFDNPAQFAALTDIKILSGTTATPVSQAADRTINLILRAI